jgi:hypothetical protein
MRMDLFSTVGHFVPPVPQKPIFAVDRALSARDGAHHDDCGTKTNDREHSLLLTLTQPRITRLKT